MKHEILHFDTPKIPMKWCGTCGTFSRSILVCRWCGTRIKEAGVDLDAERKRHSKRDV